MIKEWFEYIKKESKIRPMWTKEAEREMGMNRAI